MKFPQSSGAFGIQPFQASGARHWLIELVDALMWYCLLYTFQFVIYIGGIQGRLEMPSQQSTTILYWGEVRRMKSAKEA
ncbi:hypothetical protein TNCV_2199221 [Trichonephila clavipes]|nr:hypothetical protein TNCV_2199221 [Trichonephila clavipes]